jgi:hypothetical protein
MEVEKELSMRSWILVFGAGLSLVACKGEPSNHGDDTGAPPIGLPSLAISVDPEILTDLALQAVDASPTWLQDDLVINLAKVDADLQDALASVILDESDPNLVDEIAFGIAHTSPETMSSSTFYPDLFRVNAEYIYKADPSLDYVELVEVGEAGVDPDWYTTTSYRVQDEDGTVREVTIDRDRYYWNVVHPRLEDEPPRFIDGWDSASATSPEEGYFWREFLWERALEECPIKERECPILDGWMDGIDVLWKHTGSSGSETSAISRVFDFVHTAIHWGAGAERPVQPVRIYVVGCGNCGEHADLGDATARTALIPGQNVGAFANDHTWDEFWDESWIAFDVTGSSINYFGNYKGGISRNLVDDDCDGITDFGDDTSDTDGDGVTAADGDCNDTDALVYPGATELPNGVDDDCDGLADGGFADSELDGDADGWSILAGDCDDFDAAIFPGAKEVVNAIDDDCDGVADDGLDTTDADADGWSIADGDCNDADAGVYPAAVETGDARDQDCDGIADNGLTDHDRDGDGYTMAGGDCNDLSGAMHPGAQDPYLSSNRLFEITAARGDTFISVDRTIDYVTRPSYLDFTVSDRSGAPVDGAMVTIFGTWGVYGYPDKWAWAGQVVTDLDGHVNAIVGEANPYGWAVTSGAGDDPGGNYLEQVTDMSVADQTYFIEPRVDEMPVLPEVTETDLTGGAKPLATLSYTVDVESYRVQAQGFYSGSMSIEHEGGRLDVFVVDEANYALFQKGSAFLAQKVARATDSTEAQVDLSGDRTWKLVLANMDSVASTMVGSVTVSVVPASGVTWDGEVAPVETRVRIPPQSWFAVDLTF